MSSTLHEDENIYQLQPKENIDAAMEQYALGKSVGVETDWFCEHCKEKRAFWNNDVIVSHPEILILEIERNVYLNVEGEIVGQKDTTPVQLKMSINPSPLFSKSKRIQDEMYELTSVICHQGDFDGGHWIAFVRDAAGWNECSDERVTQISKRR